MVVFLFLVGELLEGVAAGRARGQHPRADGSRAEDRACSKRMADDAGSAGRAASPSAPSSSCAPATASPPTA